jgi:glucokinase
MSERLLVGIDLGGTNCRGALLRADGGIISSRRMETRVEEGLEALLSRLTHFVQQLLAAASAAAPEAVLGIGTPGLIAADGTVAASPNLPPLNGICLAERLRERLGLPVVVVNDANAIAWGEARFGAGRGLDSFLTVTLGTGVGGGLVLARRLWEGADGAAGEVGHIMVEPEGRPCGCGSRGCLEQYASATGMVKSVRELLAAGQTGALSLIPDAELDSRRIAEAARQGDAVALSALDVAGRRLGQVLAGVANLLNLDGVVVTGGASENLALMRPALEREMRSRAFAVPARRLQIRRGEAGEDAGILGAALLARERLANT